MLPPGRRFPAQVRFWVNDEDVVEEAVGEGGRGPYAADVFPAGQPSPLRATSEARRVELGEPECTGYGGERAGFREPPSSSTPPRTLT